MTGRSKDQFTAAMYLEVVDLIKEKVEDAWRREWSWWEPQWAEIRGIRDSVERTAQMRALRAARAARRENLEDAATIDTWMAAAVRLELGRLGWDHRWQPLPSGAVGAGRGWGVSSSLPFDGRLSFRLPAELADKLRRACYWTSQKHVEALQRWHDYWGDGPEVLMRRAERGEIPYFMAMLLVAFGSTPRREDMEAKREAQANIVTTGDVLRAAAARSALPVGPDGFPLWPERPAPEEPRRVQLTLAGEPEACAALVKVLGTVVDLRSVGEARPSRSAHGIRREVTVTVPEGLLIRQDNPLNPAEDAAM